MVTCLPGTFFLTFQVVPGKRVTDLLSLHNKIGTYRSESKSVTRLHGTVKPVVDEGFANAHCDTWWHYLG